MIRTLHKDTDVRLIAYPGMGDWLPDAPRVRGGRALIAARDDGKRLGKNFKVEQWSSNGLRLSCGQIDGAGRQRIGDTRYSGRGLPASY